MALIKCIECGKEFSDRASACPNCGCPLAEMDLNTSDKTIDENQSGSDSNQLFDSVKEFGSSAIDSWNNRNRATSKTSAVKVDEIHKVFQINRTIPKNGKKSGIIGKSFRGVMAVSTVGLSVAAEKAMGFGGKSVGKNKWFKFDDLLSYELFEDDSTVTSGGVGQALIGGALFGGAGAIAGGITGKRKNKKKIESLIIKVTLNSFDVPCIFIPIITKSTKVGSKEYMNALEEAHRILSVLDVIVHNN